MLPIRIAAIPEEHGIGLARPERELLNIAKCDAPALA
jgi:hypothetical protein